VTIEHAIFMRFFGCTEVSCIVPIFYFKARSFGRGWWRDKLNCSFSILKLAHQLLLSQKQCNVRTVQVIAFVIQLALRL